MLLERLLLECFAPKFIFFGAKLYRQYTHNTLQWNGDLEISVPIKKNPEFGMNFRDYKYLQRSFKDQFKTMLYYRTPFTNGYKC